MKINLVVIVLLIGFLAKAQQKSNYTQYMYNMSVVNPAYMINEPGLYQIGSLYRSQWIGVTGAPITANIFAHIPINNQIEFSVNYVNDKIGSDINIAKNIFNIDAAYKIKLNQDTNLAFGLKIGVDNLTINASNSNISGDPLFEDINKNYFTAGAGVYLFKENYYAGLSVPNLLPSKIAANNNGSLYKAKQHYYLIAGYVFDVNSFKIKPSIVVKEVAGTPLSFDGSLNLLYNNRFELGAAYRYNESVSGLIAIYLTPSLRLGYAYDYNTNALKDYNSGSHEFMLLYKFDLLSLGKKYSSPRFY